MFIDLSFRLGERNCVEIVAKLISSKLLDVVFTTDGKEYVTPLHLTKELKDEAYVQGGVYKTKLNLKLIK